MGTPTYHGEAVKAIAHTMKWEYNPHTGLADSGKLAGVIIKTVDEMHQLIAELGDRVPSITPPESTLPTPAQAAVPIPAEEALSLSPEVKAEATAQRAAADAAPPAPAKRGRKAKEKSKWAGMKKPELVAELESRDGQTVYDPNAAALQTEIDYLKAALAAAKKVPDRVTSTDNNVLWADCLPLSGTNTARLDDYIDERASEVATAGNAPHILTADNNSPIAYGKWKGFLEAAIKANPPTPDAYRIFPVKGNEVNEVVVQTLRKMGWLVHRGI